MAKELRELPIEERKKARELLASLRQSMVEQNAKYNKLFIAPNKHAIQVIDDTLKRNQVTHVQKTMDECLDCLTKTAARYKEVHKLFKKKRKIVDRAILDKPRRVK